MHVVLAMLPKTFKCCANPDVHIVDVAVEKWFKYVQLKTFMYKDMDEDYYYLEEDIGYGCDRRRRVPYRKETSSLREAIVDANTISATTRSFGQFIEQSNWLHANYGPDRDKDHRLDRLLRCIASMYTYCCNWAYTDGIYNRYGGRPCAVPLTDEAIEAFRALYDQCKCMQDIVLRYVLSADFAREVAKKPKKTANRQRSVVLDVFHRFHEILLLTAKFDVRGSADLWKYIVKLSTNHADTLIQSSVSQIYPLLRLLYATIRDMDYDDADGLERNIKLALFHAKIMLRLYQLFAEHLSSEFEEYAELLLFFKNKFTCTEDEPTQALIGVMQDMFPILYRKAMCRQLSMNTDKMLQLDLYMNILTLLLNEKNEETIHNFAKCAFLVSQFATILQNIAIADKIKPPASTIDHYCPIVVRIATLTVLTGHRFPHLIDVVDRALCDSLFHNNYFEALLAFDVWQLRCRFMSPEQCQHYLLRVWSPNTGNSVFCYRAGSVFMRTLLCSFYDALPLESQNTFIDALAAHTDDENSSNKPATTGTSRMMKQVWRVLGVERISDPVKRQQIAASNVDTYTLAAQKLVDTCTDNDYAKQFYARERARHGLRGIRTDQTIFVLGELCDRFHTELTICFSVELDHLLGHANCLTEAQVLQVLEALMAHFTKRAAERDVDQHPDTLIRLQTVDWLCHAAIRPLSLTTDNGSKCVRRMAELFGHLLHAPPVDGDGIMMIAYDAFVQTNCMRRFVDVGPQMQQEAIIGKTLKHNGPLKLEVARVLRKERQPAVAASITDAKRLEKPGKMRYPHWCKGRFNDLNGRKIEASIGDLEKTIFMLDRVHANGQLAYEHYSKLRDIEFKMESIHYYNFK